MTAAWLEDDEIECVWLGEGRIEHKPVLRKITIYSRWLDQTLLAQHMRFYIQSWRLAQTHLWAAEGGSPRLCNPVERWLNSANNFHLISCLLAPCLSALWNIPRESQHLILLWALVYFYIFKLTAIKVVVDVQLRRISATFTLRHKLIPSPRPQPSTNPLSSRQIRASSLIFPVFAYILMSRNKFVHESYWLIKMILPLSVQITSHKYWWANKICSMKEESSKLNSTELICNPYIACLC